MHVTVEVVGEGVHEFDVGDETYADLLERVDLSPHEVSVMVDGRPVPEDQPVESERVTVLRLVRGGSDASGVCVRAAERDDRVAALNVLDAAMLETDADALAEHIDAGSVLVAADDGRIVGVIDVAVTPPGGHVEAVAVRRARRGQGIGSRLVAAASERWRPLSAAFDGDVKPFYEALGFDVRSVGPDRYHGVLHERRDEVATRR